MVSKADKNAARVKRHYRERKSAEPLKDLVLMFSAPLNTFTLRSLTT